MGALDFFHTSCLSSYPPVTSLSSFPSPNIEVVGRIQPLFGGGEKAETLLLPFSHPKPERHEAPQSLAQPRLVAEGEAGLLVKSQVSRRHFRWDAVALRALIDHGGV